MNVPVLIQTNVTPTLCVTTLTDHTSVDVLVVIRVMEEAAQVKICSGVLSLTKANSCSSSKLKIEFKTQIFQKDGI